ncbi:MAG: response regulator transcription factor [Chloroflexi bacterium]|nr:response regulator transcription factor [Chloroflexota bacterium]
MSVLENLHQAQATTLASLLLVDAQISARACTAENLRLRGYAVVEASSGEEAFAHLETYPCDLVVLDVALRGTDGVTVMRRLRADYPDLPLIVLTSHPTVESAVAAVKLNVVDYLTKPCKTDDLVLTITRALEARAQQLRQQKLLALVGAAMEALREPATVTQSISVPIATPTPVPTLSSEVKNSGIVELDRSKRQLKLRMNPPRIIDLTEGELSVLIALMEKPNQVLSYNDLAKSALGYEGMDKWTVESVIRSTVFRLRHKIETGPDAPCLIRTVRGRGYFFSPV